MGNREDLLEGAKRCLYDKGYARTTARDIATAAGVSLAAIGYHYGTKDALLHLALTEALAEWGEDLARLMARETDPVATPEQRFEHAWAAVLASFERNRPLWKLQFELIPQLDANEELRQAFTAATEAGRLGLVELFGAYGTEGADRLRLGALYQALLAGVAAQWLLDPGDTITGAQMLAAMRTLTPAPRPTS
ncbi:TetR/AcrR family transcriptional regulator [Hamadaea tsunoensis]|uniref:TetR/AcrR family transcriptional regulator n=1 Tax=Hamadaea tsunoensis TaxID=53368 RepID=UPI0003FB7BED|nr:TetR/AcrR family transcriptional regulator [Hamadaea tsunoensis]